MVTSVLKEVPASIIMTNPEDGGSRLLWNIHNQLSDYMAVFTAMRTSSFIIFCYSCQYWAADCILGPSISIHKGNSLLTRKKKAQLNPWDPGTVFKWHRVGHLHALAAHYTEEGSPRDCRTLNVSTFLQTSVYHSSPTWDIPTSPQPPMRLPLPTLV
jgi:hypothetical protein